MRVHVTGGKGFLGRYVTAALGDRHAVEVSDLDEMDVTVPEAVLEGLSETPDVVCHLAGLTGAAASRQQPERFFEVNTLGTVNVLEACRRHGIRHLVFLSTLTVHGPSLQPVAEDSPLAPAHPYAASKAAAEILVGSYGRSYDIASIVLRATLVAGEGQVEPNAVSQFVDRALADETIELYGDGSHQREWLHPADLARAVAAAVDRLAAEDSSTTRQIIVSPGEAISMRALAERVIARIGRGRIEHSHPTAQTFSLTTVSTRAGELLGWRPEISLDEIIDRVAAWRTGEA